MLIFIIPTFAKMFTDFGGELPLPDARSCSGCRTSCAATGGCCRRWRSSAPSSPSSATTRPRTASCTIDALMLKIPVLGDVLRKGAVARFTRTLGHADRLGRADPDRARDHRPHRGQQGHRRKPSWPRAPRIREGETIAAPLKAVERVPADGGADDRGRRADRRAGRDAHQDRRSSTTTRSTRRSTR